MPQIPSTQQASPATMPKPTDISAGPSDFSAGARWNRDVSTWNPKTPSIVTPNSTHVVGWVNAAAAPISSSAIRDPQCVRAGPRNGNVSASRNSTVMLSRYPTYGVVRNIAAAARIDIGITSQCFRDRYAPAANARPVRTGIPSIRNAENEYLSMPATRCNSAPASGVVMR